MSLLRKAYEDAEINEHGYNTVCFSLRLLYFTMAAVNRRDISKAGVSSCAHRVKTSLIWKRRVSCLLSLSRHVTPWVFSSLKSSSISHNNNPTSPWLIWVNSLLHREREGRQIRFFCQWLLWALFPVPQPLFLTKTWQTLSLQGMKGRVTILCNS